MWPFSSLKWLKHVFFFSYRHSRSWRLIATRYFYGFIKTVKGPRSTLSDTPFCLLDLWGIFWRIQIQLLNAFYYMTWKNMKYVVVYIDDLWLLNQSQIHGLQYHFHIFLFFNIYKCIKQIHYYTTFICSVETACLSLISFHTLLKISSAFAFCFFLTYLPESQILKKILFIQN